MSNITNTVHRRIQIPEDLYAEIKIENTRKNLNRLEKNKSKFNTHEEMIELLREAVKARKAK